MNTQIKGAHVNEGDIDLITLHNLCKQLSIAPCTSQTEQEQKGLQSIGYPFGTLAQFEKSINKNRCIVCGTGMKGGQHQCGCFDESNKRY